MADASTAGRSRHRGCVFLEEERERTSGVAAPVALQTLGVQLVRDLLDEAARRHSIATRASTARWGVIEGNYQGQIALQLYSPCFTLSLYSHMQMYTHHMY